METAEPRGSDRGRPGRPARCEADAARTAARPAGQSGMSLVEILLVVVVLAVVGAVLYGYIGSTTQTLETVQRERPLATSKLVADRATLAAMRSSLQVYYGQHGQWPASKDAVVTLLKPPPVFQCTGNDFTYDARTGQLELVITDASRC